MSAFLAGFLGKRAAGIIGGVLGFIIPVPLVLILAALAWVHFDKSSAIRKAIDDRVTEMVAGAEIAALEAQLAAQRDIAARLDEVSTEAQRRTNVAVAAQLMLANRLQAAEQRNGDLNDDLDDLLSRPVAGDCAVDSDLIGRLRGR